MKDKNELFPESAYLENNDLPEKEGIGVDFVAVFGKDGRTLPPLKLLSPAETAWTLTGRSGSQSYLEGPSEEVAWTIGGRGRYSHQQVVRFPSEDKAVFSYYLTSEDRQGLCVEEDDQGVCAVHLFHGYILDKSYLGGAKETKDLSYEENYYGTYARGCIRGQGAVFSTDEAGISPLYYADFPEYLLVGNAPHLMAMYLRQLSLPVRPEEQLPMWYVINNTTVSDCTGYREIKRLGPHMIMRICSPPATVSFSQTKTTQIPQDHKEMLWHSIESLDMGIRAIASRFPLKAALTGGYDTRLVLSILLHSDLAKMTSFLVNGSEQHPDVVAAKQIARFFQLDLTCRPRAKTASDMYTIEECLALAQEKNILSVCEKGFADVMPKGEAHILTGMTGEYSRPYEAQNYLAVMRRKFHREIDPYHLSQEELAVSYDCLGYSDKERYYLTQDAWEVFRENRRHVFEARMERFQNALDVADYLSVDRYRNHFGGHLYRNCNLLLLNNPILFQSGRTYSEPDRRHAKFFFELIYHCEKKLTFMPLENRVWDPDCYANTPIWERIRYQQMKPVSSPLIYQEYLDHYTTLVPWIKKNLLDALPSSTYQWVKRDAVEAKIREMTEQDYGRPIFPIMNLVGYSLWYEFVQEQFNCELLNG